MNEEYYGHDHMYHMDWQTKKEYKLAMWEKYEKILEAKLEFIRKMKEIIKKMPENQQKM